MNQRRKLGLAMVGAGSVVEHRHVPAIATLDGIEVRTVYDPDRRAAERVAAAAGARVAASVEEAIHAEGVDAVTVASPNVHHRAGVEAAAAAGKHVFCEKPIATSLRDARAVVEAARRAGVVLQVGFHHRFMSEHRTARRLLEAGVIGEVRAFQATMSEPLDVIPGGAGNYRLKPEQSGGLTLIDFGSHRIDQLRALLGDAARVEARFASVAGGHGLDDNITLQVEMRSGALGTLGFHRFSRGAVSTTMLVGTKGMLCFNSWVVNPFHAAPVAVFTEEPLPADVLTYTRPVDWWRPPQPGWTALWPPAANPYAEEYGAFLAAVGGGAPPVTGEDGYRALEIVIAAYKSFHSGRAADLPLDAEEDVPVPRFR